ncbi:TetR/AcrR family transcriptional regulator [Micromonospora zhanjiangensis]|uniref:TetR family transcriptional regulator n=1 Tax=Micromonospora zhanjiangensis TaxID=1522057 RepID=A0ABV8KRN6_9ACTN
MTAAAAPRRSDVTRAAILDAARARFAADGYERATIRAIAADAGIDPAMVMRYYGNKEKLFAAAADFDLRMPDLTGLSETGYGRALARHFVHRWEADDTFLALLRAAVSNEAARDRMRQVFASQIGPLVASVCPPGQADTRAGLVASQALGLAFCRYALRLQPLAQLSEEELVDWLAPTLQRYLTGSRSDAG